MIAVRCAPKPSGCPCKNWKTAAIALLRSLSVLVPASNARRALLLASVSPLNLAIGSPPLVKWVLERVNFLACCDKLPFWHPSFDQANVRQEAFSVLFTLGAKPVP